MPLRHGAGSGPRSRAWRGSALAAILLACAVASPAQSTPERLDVSADRTISFAPAESKSYSVMLTQGFALGLQIEQTAGSIELTGTPQESQVPRTNPAGLHSSLTVMLLGPAGEITLRNLSKSKPAEVIFHAASPHALTEQDQKQAAAEAVFAHAESIRLQRKAADYPKALADYDEAIAQFRALADEASLARVQSWKALFLFVNQNDPAAARPIAEEALTHLSAVSPAEAANCHKIAGYVHVQLAQYDAGRKDYLGAIAIYKQTGDLFNQEVLLDNLSRVERLEGNTDAALAAAEQAESLAAQLGDPLRQLKIKSEIGAIELSSSNLQAAYTAYQGALELARTTPDPTTEAYIWSDLGVLYTTLREPQQARNALDQALEIWKLYPNPAGELNTIDDYGDFWISQSRTQQARALYLRGLTLARSESLARPEVFLLRGLGATSLLEGDLPGAQRNLDQALALALKVDEGDVLPEIYCLLGDLHVKRRQLSEAEQAYQRCSATAASAKDAYNTIRADGSLARLRFQQGRPESAQQSIERALAGIEATRTSIPEQDLRTSFFASMRSYYELAIDILERLDQLHPQEGYQWSAFLTAERARARMLLDQVRGNQVRGNQVRGNGPVQAASPLLAEYAEVEAELRRNQQALAALPRNVAAQKRKQLTDAIARLTVQDHALAGEVAASKGATSDLPPLTLQALQAELPREHAVLLEFWTGKDRSYLWAATPTGFRCFVLPPSAILRRAVAAFLHQVLAPASQDPLATAEDRARSLPLQARELDRQATALRTTLFPAGAIPSHATSLLIAADGPLESIPFAALSLCPNCELLAEPSATFLETLLAQTNQPHASDRVAVFTESGGGSEIPFVTEEAVAIRELFGDANAHILSGAAASPEAIRNFSWEGFSIGHFAAHATLNRANLQLSGLLLPTAGRGDDSTLWYGDICRLHTRLELVVLSACNTASGEDIPGEGLVGLTQAFFTAGAQRVLGSLWAVDDEATSVLMKRFYTALRTGRSPAGALRIAQSGMASTERWHLPYYWAGFSLAGDWRKLP